MRPARRARTRATPAPMGTGIMFLKQYLGRSLPLLGAAALAFVLGFAAAWIATRTEVNGIRAELRGETARIGGELDAFRTGPAASGGDTQEQIADLLERVALIERHLGLAPAALPPSAAGADREDRPPLPPLLPPGR